MDRDQLSPFSKTFVDAEREQEFVAHSWKPYSETLRTPLLLLGIFISAGLYLDQMWYGFSSHFFAFGLYRVSVTLAAFFVAWLCLKNRKPAAFDWAVALLQTLVLSLWLAIFYDRMFLNTAGIVSESFFTVLFVTYPLLVFYVIRGSIHFALINSLLALLIYIGIIIIMPQINLQNRVTEVLVFMFFIYYSFVLQRQLNSEERRRFSITQKQEAAIKLAQKENTEKSRFIAGTSHDLRQPLHALSLHMDLLGDQLQESRQAAESLQHAKTSLSSLNGLLNALLDISKLDAGAVEFHQQDFKLQPLLEKLHMVYSQSAAASGTELRLRNPDLTAFTDPVMLERALGNLLNNAIQHAGSGRILLASRLHKGKIRIEVWDQGPGIPAKKIGLIFSEYQQLDSAKSEKQGGLGLGLSIVQRICDALELGLSVRSRPGRGSVFAIDIPIGHNAKPADSNTGNRESVTNGAFSLEHCRIILIDDDAEVRYATQALFESWNCKAVIVPDRKALLAALDPAERPDLILSDLNLPDGVTGEELIHEIREYYKQNIPALLITGNTRIHTAAGQTEDDRLLLLYKPLRAAQLRMAMTQLLQSGS